jgi:hypothetical protein
MEEVFMIKKAKQQDAAVKVYANLLTRVEKSLAEAEFKTWESVKEEIEKAVEFEQELAEFTREEVSLIKTYLQRDLKELIRFIAETGHGLREWLQFDVELIESKLRSTLLSIADKTAVEQENLELLLNHQPGTYVAGEIACPGMLRCTQCGKMICLVETAHVEPCHSCESVCFLRVTSRWPYLPEVENPVDESET